MHGMIWIFLMDYMMDYFWIFMTSLRTHDAMADLYASW